MIVGLAFAANAIFNFLIALLVAKFLGPAEYGRFAIAWAGAVLAVRIIAALEHSGARFSSAYPPGDERVQGLLQELRAFSPTQQFYDEAATVLVGGVSYARVSAIPQILADATTPKRRGRR